MKEALDTNNLLRKGFITVFVSSVFFGVLGCVVGGMIGFLLPEYYRTVFRIDIHTSEVWKLGAGLGLTQGLVAGIAVGCVVLLSTAWYKSRMNNSVALMIAQLKAFQATSPEVKTTDEVDITKLTKTKSNES